MQDMAFEVELEGLVEGLPVDFVNFSVSRNGKANDVPSEGTRRAQPLAEGDQFRTYCVSGRNNEEILL